MFLLAANALENLVNKKLLVFKKKTPHFCVSHVQTKVEWPSIMYMVCSQATFLVHRFVIRSYNNFYGWLSPYLLIK